MEQEFVMSLYHNFLVCFGLPRLTVKLPLVWNVRSDPFLPISNRYGTFLASSQAATYLLVRAV